MTNTTIWLLIIALFFSFSSSREFSSINFESGFYYYNFKQSGTSVSILHFMLLRENNESSQPLDPIFIEQIDELIDTSKVKKYTPMKLGSGPKLGFELCDEDTCECLFLTNYSLINFSQKTQVYFDKDQAEELWKMVQ